MATATVALQKVRNGMLAIGICASLAVGSLGFAGSAEARVPEGDRVSETSFYCGMYQDMYDKAKETLKKYPNSPQAQQDLNIAVDAWYDNNCDDYYGTLSQRVVVQPGVTKNIEGIGTVGTVETAPVLHGPTGSRSSVSEASSDGAPVATQPMIKRDLGGAGLQTLN
jgi:hypothetical protein